MKNLTWQNPEQLFVAQELINKVKSKCCGIKDKYIQTRFLRFLLMQSVSSINLSSEKFQFIPLQDFTSNSDIDWSKSISEIGSHFYAKYGLSEEEIAFIESIIKAM